MVDGYTLSKGKKLKKFVISSGKAGLVCLLLAGCLDFPSAEVPGVETDNLLPSAIIISPPKIADLNIVEESDSLITSHIYLEGSDIVFEGIGFDPEDDTLGSASLQWTSDTAVELGMGSIFTKSDLPTGMHWIYLEATDSGGATARDSVYVAVTTGSEENLAPVAEILTEGLQLVDGVLYLLEDESLILEGSGVDYEDGILSGSSLYWSSSLNEGLGTGESLDVTDLLLGDHIITLTAVDSEGLIGIDSIQVMVEETLVNLAPVAEILKEGLNLENDVLYLLEGESLNLEGRGIDEEDGTLSEKSLEWTDETGEILATGKSLVLPELKAGTYKVLLTAVDSQDAKGQDSISIKVTANLEPVATITSLKDGSSFLQTEELILEGNGKDPEDGVLGDASLSWGSDIDGHLGTGSLLNMTGKLSFGTHNITLTATDKQGVTGSHSVRISIIDDVVGEVPAAPTNLRAEATGLLGTTVKLSWQDNSDNEIRFRVEQRLLNLTEFTLLNNIGDMDATSLEISGLLSGTYEFRIYAENEYGISEYSNITEITIL